MPLCSADKTISVFLWEYFVLLNYPNISELMLRLIDGRIVSRFTKQARGHLAWPAFRMTIEFELIFKKNIHRFESIEIGFVCRRRRLPLVVLLSMKLVRFLHTILFFRFCSHHDDTPCTGIKLTPHFYCWKLNRNRIRLQIPFKTLTSSSLEQNQCQNSTVIQPPSNDPMKWGGQKKTKTKKQMKSSEEMRKNVISIIIRVSMCPVAPLYSEIHGMNAVRSLFSTFND